VIAEQNGRREVGSGGGGGRFGLGYFQDEQLKLRRPGGQRRADQPRSRPGAPAGEMTVVLGPGWPGVLLHEAVGHGLEGDFNRKGSEHLLRPHRPARGGQGRDRARRRHHPRPPRLAQHRRRRPRHASATC
jgi:predicted Zn-dependent protease